MKRLTILIALFLLIAALPVIHISNAAEPTEVVMDYPEIPDTIPKMDAETIAEKYVTLPSKWQTLLWGFVAAVIVMSIAAKKPRRKPESTQ